MSCLLLGRVLLRVCSMVSMTRIRRSIGVVPEHAAILSCLLGGCQRGHGFGSGPWLLWFLIGPSPFSPTYCARQLRLLVGPCGSPFMAARYTRALDEVKT
ncbi:hypothetical protein BJX62DRAFT_124478 [Aspergillus germanicus]